MTHDQATELLASYALDAVSRHEHDQIEEHLKECPPCRSQLDGYREVAGAMGNSVEPLPEGLWSSIAARLPERPQEDAHPMPRLIGGGRNLEETEETDIPVRLPRRLQFSKGPIATVGSIAVAAAAIAVVFAVGMVRTQHQLDTANAQVSHQTSALRHAEQHPRTISAEQAALRTPGHVLVKLANGTANVATFVVVPDGRGYLVSSSLPSLPSTEVYQLWGIVGQQPISLGLLGSSLSQAGFTMAGSTQPSRLSLTVEPAGGTPAPTAPILASGTV